MVRAPGHPRAGRSPYVFEHILIAEEILDRYLVDGVSVHHINRVRDDNRPNLELWTRPQPSGITVSDAIAWARSIYDRYVDVGRPPTVLTLAPEHPSFVRALARFRLRGSMGPVAACADNAPIESFCSLLQKKVLNSRTWPLARICTWPSCGGSK